MESSYSDDLTKAEIAATVKYVDVFLTLCFCVVWLIIQFSSGVLKTNRKAKSIMFGKIILNSEARRIST